MMKCYLLSITALLLPALLFSQHLTVLQHVSIVDGTGRPVQINTNMVIDKDRIRSIGKPIPTDATAIDMTGKFIMPLLINGHGHLGILKDTATAAANYTSENVRHQLARYLDYGVGEILSMGTEQPLGLAIRDSSRRGLIYGATMYSALYGFGVKNGFPPEGAGFNHVFRPETAAEAIGDVDKLAPLKPDVIKMWVQGPNIMKEDIYAAIIKEAHQKGIRVACHVYNLADAEKLVADGVDIIAHSIRDAEISDAFVAEIKKRHIIYIPTLSLDEAAFIYEDDPDWLNDPFFKAALEPGVYEMITSPAYKERLRKNPNTAKEKEALRIALKNLYKLYKAGVLIALGTDSGAQPLRVQGFSEHLELELMVAAGLTPLEAIRVGTLNGAVLLTIADRTGSLEAGKQASFIVLGKDPSMDIRNTRTIESIWVKGKQVK